MNGKEKTQIQGGAGRGGAGRGWDFGSDFISGMGIHIPSRLEFGTGMGNDQTMWDGNGIRLPRPKPASLPTLHWIVFMFQERFFRPCLVGRKFFVFSIQTFRKQEKHI